MATGPRPDPETEAARADDPLLDTELAAAWTLASVAALAVPGVAGLTYLETTGPRGLVEHGDPRPVAAVLARLAALRGRPRRDADGPAGLAALAVEDDGGTLVLLANLTAQPRTVRVQPPAGEPVPAELTAWGTAEVRLG